MKFSCCCGIFIGFLLASLGAAGVWYYFYCKENPDAPQKSMDQVENTWNKTKDTGDKVITFIKPFTQQEEQPAVQNNNSSENPFAPKQ